MITEIILICSALVTGEVFSKKLINKPIKRIDKSQASGAGAPLNTDDKPPVKVGSAVRDQKGKLDHYTGISNASFAVSTVGALFFPPLSLLCVPAFLYMGYPVFKSTYNSLIKNRTINVDLMSTLFITGTLGTGNLFAAAFSYWLYFNALKLLRKVEHTSNKSLTGALSDIPKNVWLVKDGVEIEIPFTHMEKNQIIAVGAGETIPADGIVTGGAALVDQQVLTGESAPIDKKEGNRVYASTLMLSGKLYIRVTTSGEDTTASKISEILRNTADFKTNLQVKGEAVADKGALPTLFFSAAALPFKGVAGAVSVMNAGFGYNMRLTSPITMLNFMTLASQNSILIKDGKSLDLLKDIDTVVFDKTGTLTLTKPEVLNVSALNGYSGDELIALAASVERFQEHPVALALKKEAEKRSMTLFSIADERVKPGMGIRGTIDDAVIRVGNVKFLESEGLYVSEKTKHVGNTSARKGKTPVYVAKDDDIIGVVELKAGMRPEISVVVDKLKERGLKLYVLSGDLEKPTRKLAEQLGLNGYYAEIMPEKKAELIDDIQKKGKSVLFVGDGINDAVALKKARVSVSLQGASSIAVDTAHVILMDESLHHLPYLLQLSDDFEANMKTGYALSVIPGIFCVGAVFFLDFGLVSTTLIYNGGLILGLGNAMLPLVKEKHRKNHGNLHKNLPMETIRSFSASYIS